MSKPSSKFPMDWILLGVFIVFMIFTVFIALGPIGSANPVLAQESKRMQTCRSINLLMFQYSVAHAGKYPDGKSSTEVFQKLLDGKYTNDPTLFYVPCPGKTKPPPGQSLKPENISWDVTSGMDESTSCDIPSVFLTGYRVTYAPRTRAEPLIKPYPDIGGRTWSGWWHGDPDLYPHPGPGIAVSYKDNSSCWLKALKATNGDYSIPNFIPATFDAHGKTYRQLTPTGPLSP